MHYISPLEAAEKEVVAIDGTSAWLLDEEELKGALSRGALLDSNAADIVIKRGHGALIGIESVQERHFSTSAEAFKGGVLDGTFEGRMPLRMRKGMWKKLTPTKKALILTEIVDPRGVRTPGTICSMNCASLFSGSARVSW